jgi:hypothetical protein
MPINNWWEGDPAESYWMEIRTELVGFGDYLLAPQHDGTGGESWSYTLVSYVQPGDRIYHWDKRPRHEPAIVGWSEVVGPLETLEWSWQARGTRGRARGVATTGPAWRVPLRNYTALDQPITRGMLNERRLEVVGALEEVESEVRGTIYSPFQHYGSREIRAAQGYLAKFPAALVDLLFAVPIQREERPVATERTKTGRVGRGQGYLSDAEKRTALERHAVELAKTHYWSAGATRIEERGKPYDLLVIVDGIERHVEVKGSVGIGLESVQLTQGEVDHAHGFQPTDLFVVDEIVATRQGDGTVSTSGGTSRLWSDWAPEDRALRPTHLRYTLPAAR